MNNRCKVCTDVSIGVQFGVQACRGCSSFFRRTITERRRYECWENERCKVIPGVRNSCRACRFKLCLKLGMEENKVQPKRDKNMTIIVAKPLPSYVRQDVPSTSEPSDLLSRLAEGFNNYLIAQKAVFTSKRPEMAAYENERMITMTASERVELEMLTFPSIYMVMRDYFCDFLEMDKTMKFNMLNHFLDRFIQLVRAYITAKRFLHSNQLNKIALSAYDYVDMKRQEEFFVEDMEAKKSFRPYVEHLHRFAQKINSLDIDEKELAALIGLSTCNIVTNLITTDKAVERFQQIIKELQAHILKRRTNSSRRLAQIVMLLRDLEDVADVFSECYFLGVIVNDIYRRALDRLSEICDYL